MARPAKRHVQGFVENYLGKFRGGFSPITQ